MRRIKGLDKVLSNLNKEIIKIKSGTIQGLVVAASQILTDADKTSPTIPVDTGNLRASRFITPMNAQSNNPYVLFGFSANYAACVHEMMGANFQRPGSGAKFLETSIKRNYDNVLIIVQKHAKVR